MDYVYISSSSGMCLWSVMACFSMSNWNLLFSLLFLCWILVTRNGNTGCLHRNLFGTLNFTELPKAPLLNIKGDDKVRRGSATCRSCSCCYGANRGCDIFQIANKWNWKWIFIQQRYVFKKIPTINANFASTYVNHQGWSLKFGKIVKMFQPKYWNTMLTELKLTKKSKICVWKVQKN